MLRVAGDLDTHIKFYHEVRNKRTWKLPICGVDLLPFGCVLVQHAGDIGLIVTECSPGV